MRLQQPFSVRWHCGPVASSSWPPSLVPLPATGLSDVLVPSWMIMMHARNQTSQHLDKYVRRHLQLHSWLVYCKPVHTNQAWSGQARSAIDGATRHVYPTPKPFLGAERYFLTKRGNLRKPITSHFSAAVLDDETCTL